MHTVPLSGFTIVRNAVLMGYPVVNSIESALPLVTEMIVAVGASDDETRALILSIDSPKIRIVDAEWDLSHSSGGTILSEKTNEALDECTNDWCLYIQADEVLHEEDSTHIRTSLQKAAKNPSVEGLHFDFVHFYGSYETVATSRKWYRDEIRMVRKSSGVRSVRDAQSFRIDDRKLRSESTNATMYHYGWAKKPEQMEQKCRLFHRWWYGNEWDEKFNNFSFKRIYGIRKFFGLHPEVMKELICREDLHFDYRRRFKDLRMEDLRLALSDAIEAVIGHQPFRRRSYNAL